MNGDLFQCVVSNDSGTATSSPVALIVATPLAVTTLAGQAGITGIADGTGTAAQFGAPSGIAADGSGNLYVADMDNDTIREIMPGGVVVTFAGQAGASGSADATGTSAQFNSPTGIAIDGAGTVYVADTGNHTIRMITTGGVVTTLAGQAGVSGSADATGTSAQFNGPTGIAVDGAGTIYVADTGNHTIRMITTGGVVTTLAGRAGVSGGTDATGTSAQFFGPQGLTVDGAGNLYVADTGNHVIRKIVVATGAVTTVAGLAGCAGSDDGPGAMARFSYPYGIALDADGNLYVADTGNSVIREITPSGVASTIAGHSGTNGSADGVGGAALFDFSAGVAADSAGNVYVADTDNFTVRAGRFPAAPMILSQPHDLASSVGAAVHFSVIATGSAPLTFQWNLNGLPIAGANSSSLSLGNAQTADVGSYSVTVINDAGLTTSNSAMLDVLDLSIASSVLTGVVSLDGGGTGSTDGSIVGTGPLTFAVGGADQSITLSPTGTGGVMVGPANGYFAYTGRHLAGDGLIGSFPDAGSPGLLAVENPVSGAYAALTEFQFGHTLSFSNSHTELELHSFNGIAWQPVATFVGSIGDNTIFLRNTSDTNSLMLNFSDYVGHPLITTELGPLDIELAPGRNLLLTFAGTPAGFLSANSPGGGLYIAAQGGNQDVRIAPSGSGRIVLNGNTLMVGSVHSNADIMTGNPAGGQQASWKLGSHTTAGAVQIDVANVGYNLPAGKVVRQGTAVLAGGLAVVNDSAVTAATRIFVGCVSPAGTPGALYVKAKNLGVGFTIASTSSTDKSTVSYLEIDP